MNSYANFTTFKISRLRSVEELFRAAQDRETFSRVIANVRENFAIPTKINTMLTRGVTTTTFVLLACLQIVLSHAPADPTTQPTPTWRKNCFSETETESSNDCNANTIEIFSQYYTCDLAIETDNIPEEIAYLHGTILVAVGDETFFVHNEQLESAVGKMSFPPSWNDFTDKNDNRFYVNDNGTLVTENRARSNIEILTTGEFIKQIVLDADLNKLLILSYNPGDSAGSLFALNTDSLKSAEDDKLQATKIEKTGEDISAFAVESGTTKLLLGLRTEKGGGKIIRLSRQERYPCTENVVGKRAIMHIIEETIDRISKTLEEILIEKPSPRTGPNLLLELERKNKDLTKEVVVLRNQLETYKRPPGKIGKKKGRPMTDNPKIPEQPITLPQYDLSIIPYVVNRGRFVFQCVTMNDFEKLKTKFIENEKTITQLRQKLDQDNHIQDKAENIIMELRQQLDIQANTRCTPPSPSNYSNPASPTSGVVSMGGTRGGRRGVTSPPLPH